MFEASELAMQESSFAHDVSDARSIYQHLHSLEQKAVHISTNQTAVAKPVGEPLLPAPFIRRTHHVTIQNMIRVVESACS
jgi:hypothetical protein